MLNIIVQTHAGHMCFALRSCVSLFSVLHGLKLACVSRKKSNHSYCKENHDDEMNFIVTQQVDQGLRFSFGIKHSEFVLPIREDPLADQ